MNDLLKSRVAAHLRHEASGKVTRVNEYVDKRAKKANVTKMPNLKEIGGKLAITHRMAKFKEPRILDDPIIQTKDGEKVARIIQTHHVVKKTEPAKFQAGSTVKYKREGVDQYVRSGTFIRETAGAYFIMPKRNNRGENDPIKLDKKKDTLMHERVYRQKEAAKGSTDKTKTADGDRAMARHNLTAGELIRRKHVVEERLGYSEDRIVNHPSFIGPAIKISAELATQNGIPTTMLSKPTAALWHQASDANYQEILFHYAQGAIKAWRRELANPLTDANGKRLPDADQTENNVKEFKDVLAGNRHSSYTHFVMEKEGKSSAIRWLQEYRDRRNMMHDQDLSDIESDPESRRILGERSSQPLQVKYALHMNNETLRDDIQKVITKLDPVEMDVVRMKYGFKPYDKPLDNNQEVAELLNKKGSRDPESNKWTRNTVGSLIRSAIAKLASSATKEELSYHIDEALGRPVWKSFTGATVDLLCKSIGVEMATFLGGETITPTRTICVDFDGPVAQPLPAFEKDVFGPVVNGAAASLNELKQNNWKIIIHTVRAVSEAFHNYLVENGIPYDEINENSDQPEGSNKGKPIADVYLDDRAVRFVNWDHAMSELATFQKSDHIVDVNEMVYLYAPCTRLPKDWHPEGMFKARDIEYEVVHEGEEALIKGDVTFDQLFELMQEDLLIKAAGEELMEYLENGK